MKQLEIDSFKEISILDNVKYSLDDSKTVFHAMKPNTETDGYDNTLWLLKDGKIRQLTYGNKEREFIFLDDNTVLFRSDREADRPNYSTWQTIDLETGGSYGGFMTNWVITHTDRFRAAISQCCISN